MMDAKINEQPDSDEVHQKGNPAVPSETNQQQQHKNQQQGKRNQQGQQKRDAGSRQEEGGGDDDPKRSKKREDDGRKPDAEERDAIVGRGHPSGRKDGSGIEEEDMSPIACTMRNDYMNEVCATVWKRLVIFSQGGKNKYVLNRYHLRKLNIFVRDVKGARMMIKEYVIAKERRHPDTDMTIRRYDMASQTFRDMDRLTKIQYVLVD